MPVAEAPWLTRRRPRPDAHVRLLGLPPAGENTGVFDIWNVALPEWIEVCAVQLPGRQERSREQPARLPGHLT
jgi:medium-chain acyl-[acyl-carrier-protein] hydrolase